MHNCTGFIVCTYAFSAAALYIYPFILRIFTKISMCLSKSYASSLYLGKNNSSCDIDDGRSKYAE